VVFVLTCEAACCRTGHLRDRFKTSKRYVYSKFFHIVINKIINLLTRFCFSGDQQCVCCQGWEDANTCRSTSSV